MLGAIYGDFCGSTYEFNNAKVWIKKEDLELVPKGSKLTDDSFLSIAISDALMNNKDIATTLKDYYRMYPDGDYGGRFNQWCLSSSLKPYGSFGSGSAMRVSSVGWLYNSLDEVKKVAKKTAKVTHNHPEGIKGAVCVASLIYLARTGSTKEQLKDYVHQEFPSYNIDRTLEEIRPTFEFDESCQGTVPEAIMCFLESTSYEDSIRNAIYLGGDVDTIACICGGIAEAFYLDIPSYITSAVEFPQHLKDIVYQTCCKSFPHHTILTL